jgi:hypothetical protein
MQISKIIMVQKRGPSLTTLVGGPIITITFGKLCDKLCIKGKKNTLSIIPTIQHLRADLHTFIQKYTSKDMHHDFLFNNENRKQS